MAPAVTFARSPGLGDLFARLQPAGRRDRPQHRQPVEGGERDVDPDDLAGKLQCPLQAAYGALQRQEAENHREGLDGPPVASWAPQEEPDRDRGEAVDGGDRGVALDHPLQRLHPLEVEAVDELAFVGAGVGAGGGGDRAGQDRQLPERDQRAHRPDAEAVAGAPSLPGLVARAPGQCEGRVEQHHREDEVGHDQARSEVVLDDQRAEDRLPEHPQRQQGAEQRQVPAVGHAEEGEAAGGDHGEADETGQQPVAVLDHRVGLQRRHRAAVAFGPVRAAEAGAGQSHGGAGEHDQRQSGEGDGGDLRVAPRRDLEAVFEALPHQQGMIAAAVPPPGLSRQIWSRRLWKSLCRRRSSSRYCTRSSSSFDDRVCS